MIKRYERGITDYECSDHAVEAMRARNISKEHLREVLAQPDYVEQVSDSRIAMHSTSSLDGRPYLTRVFLDVDRSPPVVVTVYRTSKVRKYWRKGQ